MSPEVLTTCPEVCSADLQVGYRVGLPAHAMLLAAYPTNSDYFLCSPAFGFAAGLGAGGAFGAVLTLGAVFVLAGAVLVLGALFTGAFVGLAVFAGLVTELAGGLWI